MQSSAVTFFRAFIMLACLAVVPLLALFGTPFPEAARRFLENVWNHQAVAAQQNLPEAPPYRGDTTPIPPPSQIDAPSGAKEINSMWNRAPLGTDRGPAPDNESRNSASLPPGALPTPANVLPLRVAQRAEAAMNPPFASNPSARQEIPPGILNGRGAPLATMGNPGNLGAGLPVPGGSNDRRADTPPLGSINDRGAVLAAAEGVQGREAPMAAPGGFNDRGTVLATYDTQGPLDSQSAVRRVTAELNDTPRPDAVVPASLSTTESSSMTDQFARIQRRLQDLGATYYLLESWGNQSQRFRFYCKMAIAGNPNFTRYFEATDANPLAAMSKVLHEVEQWQSHRTANVP